MTNDEGDRALAEFLDDLNNLAGTHSIALYGVDQFTEFMRPRIAERANDPDAMLFVGHGDPNTEEAFSWRRWPMNTLLERLDPDGPVYRDLGQQWLVMVAALWNDHYRQLFANAGRVPKNEIAVPFMADVNRMRNDVIHHRGTATKKNTGRCEVLHWFKEGEPIHIMPVHIAEFMDHLGLVRPTSEIDGGPFWEES